MTVPLIMSQSIGAGTSLLLVANDWGGKQPNVFGNGGQSPCSVFVLQDLHHARGARTGRVL